MYASQVAGLTVAPSLVENQMSGALIMMVIARCFTALIAATMSASEIDAIARDPYPD